MLTSFNDGYASSQQVHLQIEGTSPMDFTKKVMKGYVFVDISVLNTKKALEYWVKLALDYNSIAKSSKKKKK